MLLPTKKPQKPSTQPSSLPTTTDILTKAGYIYQSSAGIYTLMPLACRVVEKIESIINEEMRAVGGQKLSMPNLLTPSNWKKTGRWESTGSELFSFRDRKGATMLLGPTHEEEITAIVKDMVRSYRQYPLRLYQTTRKFRDEARPRAGLLRGREFIMKDMYSFDVDKESAIATFHELEAAYRRCFDRIRVPYLVADADSGNIGGSLSKEFHFVSPSGEDLLLECPGCGYTANEERARGRPKLNGSSGVEILAANISSADGQQQRLVVIPANHKPNTLKLQQKWKLGTRCSVKYEPIYDEAVAKAAPGGVYVDSCVDLDKLPADIARQKEAFVAGDWHVAEAGDGCGECRQGTLVHKRAIEVGHIFYLGDKYSRAIDLTVANQKNSRDYVQMGCFGIGVTRILQAAAECCNEDGQGLRWPLSIAPYTASIIPLAMKDDDVKVSEIFHMLDKRLSGDVVVDDRNYLSAGFRLNDAQLLGFPVTVVLGRRFTERGEAEVQIRIPSSQGRKESEYERKAYVAADKLGEFVENLLV